MIKNVRGNDFNWFGPPLRIEAAFVSGFAVLALAGAALGCESARAASPPAQEAFQGVVEHEDRSIGFEVGGRVLAVDVERGDRVNAGQVIAKLDDSLETPLRALRIAELHTAEAQLALLKAGTRIEDIRAAEAQIASIRAQEDIARKNLDRTKTLYERGSVALSEVDELNASVDSTLERKRSLEEQLKGLKRGARGEEISAALARVEAATAGLAAQEAKLSRYTLSALLNGDVIDVHVKPGEMVSPGALALTVADLDHPYVDVFVPQSQGRKVRVGMTAKVRVDGTPSTLNAKVEHVFPKTEFTPRYLFSEGERENLVLRVRVRIEDPTRELHGGVPAFVTLAGDAS
jgi:HlyD family secretion protein